MIHKYSSDLNIITISGNGKTINGSASVTLTNQHDGFHLKFNNTTWSIIGQGNQWQTKINSKQSTLPAGSNWQVLGSDVTYGDNGLFGMLARNKMTRFYRSASTLAFDGTIGAVTGTASGIAPTATESSLINIITAAATTGTDLGVEETVANHYFSRTIRMHAAIKLQETSAVRYWVGITGGAGTTMAGLDSAGTDIAMFRYSTVAGDVNWKCVSHDASGGIAIIDSGVPVTTSQVLLSIEHNPGVNLKFYINRVLVATHTADLPRTTTTGRMMAYGETTEAVVKNLRVQFLYSEEVLP
jgi:hypothetical protein